MTALNNKASCYTVIFVIPLKSINGIKS